MIARLWNHSATFMILLGLPGLAMTLRWFRGGAYDQLMHSSGQFTGRLLVVSLLLSPLAVLLGRKSWLRWLRQRRRHIGVAAFLYCSLHTLIYLQETGTISNVLSEFTLAVVWTGWVPFLFMLPLAVTSTDGWARKLGPKWFAIHRLAYPAAALSALHWYLVDERLVGVLAHFLPLAALEIFRIARR